MAEPVTITPDPPANPGLDYARLKVEGTRLVQQLSGDIWTDYNEHDPGVTTLEALCYALTELSYRAEFPLKDLLIDPGRRRIDTRRQTLFIPRRILPSAPLTENDYRKLIVDRVRGVANAWLIPCRETPDGVDGLYDIWAYAPLADPCCCDGRQDLNPDVIRERVRRVYCGHRSLCEDVRRVNLLEQVPTAVFAAAAIDNSLAAEAILARILFNLGNFLAPELRRLPLAALVEAGRDAAAIFNGPLLRHGFIADDQLAPKAKAILLSDVIRTIVRSAGVMSVRNVGVRYGDRIALGADVPPIPVPENQIPLIETRPKDGRYGIRLLRNGIEVKPDPARVERELQRLWNDYRRTYPLARQYKEYFGVPEGDVRDVRSYYSIQNQYPNVYGINAYGLPENATAVRKGQAKQLKGYLLAYEQLFADFFAQLANVRHLYAIDDPLAPTYFYQFLGRSVPNVERLLRPDYRAGLAHIVEAGDSRADRRNRFLDLLLALYAERMDADLMPFLSHGKHAAGRLLRAKLALLHHLVAATRGRGHGFDYLARLSVHNVAGMVIRSRIELGMSPFPRRGLGECLEDAGIAFADGGAEPAGGRFITAHREHIERTFAPFQAAPDASEAGAAALVPLRGHRLDEEYLHAVAEGEIRTGSLPGETTVTAACRPHDGGEWYLIAKYGDREQALAALQLLIATARDVADACRQLYVVEHILLRFGRRDDDETWPSLTSSPPEEGGFPYSFTITAVVSDAPRRSDAQGYRAGVQEVIRRNAPAHVMVAFCFLRPHRMAHFERLYVAWRLALRGGERERIAASRRLRSFLQRAAAQPENRKPEHDDGGAQHPF
jgi:hypothetical protein